MYLHSDLDRGWKHDSNYLYKAAVAASPSVKIAPVKGTDIRPLLAALDDLESSLLNYSMNQLTGQRSTGVGDVPARLNAVTRLAKPVKGLTSAEQEELKSKYDTLLGIYQQIGDIPKSTFIKQQLEETIRGVGAPLLEYNNDQVLSKSAPKYQPLFDKYATELKREALEDEVRAPLPVARTPPAASPSLNIAPPAPAPSTPRARPSPEDSREVQDARDTALASSGLFSRLGSAVSTFLSPRAEVGTDAVYQVFERIGAISPEPKAEPNEGSRESKRGAPYAKKDTVDSLKAFLEENKVPIAGLRLKTEFLRRKEEFETLSAPPDKYLADVGYVPQEGKAFYAAVEHQRLSSLPLRQLNEELHRNRMKSASSKRSAIDALLVHKGFVQGSP